MKIIARYLFPNMPEFTIEKEGKKFHIWHDGGYALPLNSLNEAKEQVALMVSNRADKILKEMQPLEDIYNHYQDGGTDWLDKFSCFGKGNSDD